MIFLNYVNFSQLVALQLIWIDKINIFLIINMCSSLSKVDIKLKMPWRC